MGEVLSGNLADFMFWENLTSLEVFNYASRNRLKTITLSSHLTTFCKLAAYFVLIFHGSFVFAFTCTNVFDTVGKLLAAGTQRVDGLFFTPFLSALPDPSICARKGAENPFLSSHLSQNPCSSSELAEEGGLRWDCGQSSAGLGRAGCSPALCDQSPAGHWGQRGLFLWSKIHSEFMGCLCRWLQWILLGGNSKISQLLLVSHSSALALGLPCTQEGEQHWNCVAFKHKEVKHWEPLKSHFYVVHESEGSASWEQQISEKWGWLERMVEIEDGHGPARWALMRAGWDPSLIFDFYFLGVLVV